MKPRIGITGVQRQWDGAPRAGVNAAYVESAVKAGGVPLILSQRIGPADAGRALEGVDALILTGGEDVDPALYAATPSAALGAVDRERDEFEIAILHAARARRLPALGICRGMQIINVALGGTLWQDLPSEHPSAVEHSPRSPRDARVHRVRVEPGSRAAQALGRRDVDVNSFHHQAVRDLAPGIAASAWSDDELVEAIESHAGDPWMLAVQWHPEERHADAGAAEHGLFRALIEAAGQPV